MNSYGGFNKIRVWLNRKEHLAEADFLDNTPDLLTLNVQKQQHLLPTPVMTAQYGVQVYIHLKGVVHRIQCMIATQL